MKLLVVFFFSWSAIAASPLQRGYKIDRGVFDNSNRKFISHIGSERFDSYLIQDINYAPVEALRKTFENDLKLSLLNRGEAHITVVTPIEYYDVLRSKISMQEIEQLANAEYIQASKFTIECLGLGRKDKDQTFFIVVTSPELVAIRKLIQRKFESRGGKPDTFSATRFYPHITLGFTKRDLHEADGVVKDKRSCIHKISAL